jgi:hypothetical protein
MEITSILKSKLLVWLHRLIWHLAFIFWCTHRCLSIVSNYLGFMNCGVLDSDRNLIIYLKQAKVKKLSEIKTSLQLFILSRRSDC